MLPPLHGEDGVRAPCEALEPLVVLCAPWVTPVERARGVAVLRVGLCGQIDELLVLDGGTRGTVPNTGSGLPGTRAGTALAAGARSRTAVSGRALAQGATLRATEPPAAGPSCLHLAQTYASIQPGHRLEAHRRSPVTAPQQLCRVQTGVSRGPFPLDH